mmetsp:Transcript_52589/g.163199  ORF Transcript_52589/g.163199 Transcript_52589/m.163199 type:complete len:255 (-) Transcript_52589:81-845(-)
MPVGDLAETNGWVIILVISFLFFIAAVLAAKKDSVVRAMAYTLVLVILATYLIWWQLVPEIRKWHNLVPADCMIAGKAQLLSYHTHHGHEVQVAHLPVNVSHIQCHGQIGNDIEMSDMQGSKTYNPENDVIFCSTGTTINNGSTAYIKLEDWHWLDPDEQKDAIGKYEEGKSYFCWVDPTSPNYVTFENNQDWSAIFYPLVCLFLIIFLCWSAGSFTLFGACFNLARCDPVILRIDASTPTDELRRRRGDYDII